MKTLKTIAMTFAAISAVSCGYLEFDETNGLRSFDDVYSYFDETKQMLTHVYSYIPQDFGTIGGAMRDCASDDAEFGDTGGTVQYMNNGTWSSLNTVDGAWTLYYGIRAANEFLQSFATTDFTRFEKDPDYQNWVDHMQYSTYEARILKSFFFFELAKRYGDIAMPLEKLDIEQANSIAKTSFDAVVEYIVSECDACAPNLPDTYRDVANSETGRITKGFAMALKSKALLYAASELHNPSMDTDKWKRSASAALDLIETDLYELDPADKCNNPTSPEVVLARQNDNSTTFEVYNFPIRFTEGQKNGSLVTMCTFPTQNLVDAFQTKNGYSVTLEASGWVSDDPEFNPARPYLNRDPRFTRTVLCNGDAFKGSVIALYKGGRDDAAVSDGGSPTGYFLRKYIQESTSFDPDAQVSNKHHWIVYRYAETLLTYAESMVEAFGDPDYSDAEYTYSARWALNQVRSNAGMPDVTVSGKDEFIEALRNEWRVEFAFEDHRFWDVRRWKIGSETQTDIYGVEITQASGSSYSYRRFLYESRKWNDRMYLYPIPQVELYRNSNLAPQNPGW